MVNEKRKNGSATGWMMMAFVILPVFCSGCATYVRDRTADAADIFTIAGGFGLGVTAKAGPVHTGLGYGVDLYGLRGGEFGSFMPHAPDDEWPPSWDAAAVVAAISGFTPHGDRAFARGKAFVSPFFDNGGLLPFLDLPANPSSTDIAWPHPQWTQIDVSVGLLVAVRVGFNPGELLDFILGFFGIDIYRDDLKALPADGAESSRRIRNDFKTFPPLNQGAPDYK